MRESMGKVLENLTESGKDLLKAGRDALIAGGIVYLIRETGADTINYERILESIFVAETIGAFSGTVSFLGRTCERYFPNTCNSGHFPHP